MIQDYNPLSRHLSFRPRFSRHRSHFSPRSDSSPLSLPCPPPYIWARSRPRVSRSPCCQVQAVDPYTPHLRVKFAPFG
ncbi:hypothetical protein TNCV_4276271 [Trichonephila clavipes]|nr:hypothetical protein TNCV_4276271 [Trichonephila clavipes]